MNHPIASDKATMMVAIHIIQGFGITRFDANEAGASLAVETVVRPTAFVTPFKRSTVATAKIIDDQHLLTRELEQEHLLAGPTLTKSTRMKDGARP
jgi:hypothetical protein